MQGLAGSHRVRDLLAQGPKGEKVTWVKWSRWSRWCSGAQYRVREDSWWQVFLLQDYGRVTGCQVTVIRNDTVALVVLVILRCCKLVSLLINLLTLIDSSWGADGASGWWMEQTAYRTKGEQGPVARDLPDQRCRLQGIDGLEGAQTKGDYTLQPHWAWSNSWYFRPAYLKVNKTGDGLLNVNQAPPDGGIRIIASKCP